MKQSHKSREQYRSNHIGRTMQYKHKSKPQPHRLCGCFGATGCIYGIYDFLFYLLAIVVIVIAASERRAKNRRHWQRPRHTVWLIGVEAAVASAAVWSDNVGTVAHWINTWTPTQTHTHTLCLICPTQKLYESPCDLPPAKKIKTHRSTKIALHRNETVGYISCAFILCALELCVAMIFFILGFYDYIQRP